MSLTPAHSRRAAATARGAAGGRTLLPLLGVLILLASPVVANDPSSARGASAPLPRSSVHGLRIPDRLALIMEEPGPRLPDSLVSTLASHRSRATLAEGHPRLWFIELPAEEAPVQHRAQHRAQRRELLRELRALPEVRCIGEVHENSAAVGLREPVLVIPLPELLVELSSGASREEIAARLAAIGLEHVAHFPSLRGGILHLRHGGLPAESAALAAQISGWDGIHSAEVNVLEGFPPLSIPNDPLFPQQWSLRNTGQGGGWTPGADLNAPSAWDLATGDPSVTIAIIDEGVDVTHPDLASRVLPGHDATDQPSPAAIPGNCAPADEHGTACAGIAAAAGNDGAGMTGVCWNASILPVRVGYGAYWSQLSWQVDAITWAADQGADILSNSWGSSIPSASVRSAIEYATTSGRGGLGAVVLFAAGNSDGPIVYPAKHPAAIAVGASSPCDERCSPASCDNEVFWGSCHGLELDLVAPGAALVTADNVGPAGGGAGDYLFGFNGTSAACPHVAGAAALLLSLRPDLDAVQVRSHLISAGRDLVGVPAEDTSGWDPYMGWGRLDLRLLLESALGPAPPGSLTCTPSGTAVLLEWTVPPGVSYDHYELRRNGDLIAAVPGDALLHTEPALPPGSHQYALRGVASGVRTPMATCTTFVSGGASDLVWTPPTAVGPVDGGAAISAALIANGRTPVATEDLLSVGDLDPFSRIWVTLGTSPAKHVLSEPEAALLLDYLTNGVGGSSLYLEGADTWVEDPVTSLHPLFGIDGSFGGLADLDTITGFDIGVADLSGLSMDYDGENSSIDRLIPVPPAATLLRNGPTSVYDVAIHRETPEYRTIGASLEFGGLQESGGATRAAVMAELLAALTGPSTPFLRGDADGSGSIDVADAILILEQLFLGGGSSCLDALDVNDSGSLNIADAIAALGYLFSGAAPPAPPFPTPGPDPTDNDPLDCASWP